MNLIRILGLATIIFACTSFVLSMFPGKLWHFLSLGTLLIATLTAIIMFILMSGVTITI